MTFPKILQRAQNDPQFKTSLSTLFDIIQHRLNRAFDTVADPNVTLESFIHDPTEEKHIHKALIQFGNLLERFANAPLQPLFDTVRGCVQSITRDERLRRWFNDFFELARKNLGEPGFGLSQESRMARENLRNRWNELLEKDLKWKSEVDQFKKELDVIQRGINSDEDLMRLRAAHERLSQDIQRGLAEVGAESTQAGLQAAMEQVTWFWRDLFTVYISRILAFLKDVPIPR